MRINSCDQAGSLSVSGRRRKGKNEVQHRKWKFRDLQLNFVEKFLFRRKLFCIVDSRDSLDWTRRFFNLLCARDGYDDKKMHPVRSLARHVLRKRRIFPWYSELSRSAVLIGAEDRILHWNSWIDGRGCFLQRVTTASSCDTQIRAPWKKANPICNPRFAGVNHNGPRFRLNTLRDILPIFRWPI